VIAIPDFDEDSHTYVKDGVIVPSVTTILKRAGMTSTDFIDPIYAERGTAAHKAIALLNEDALDESTVDPQIVPFVNAYRAFKADTNFHPKYSEKIVFSKKYGYAGTIDVIGDLNGCQILIDAKTGPLHEWHELQVSAYRQAALECDISVDKCFILQLKKDGLYKLRQMKDTMAFAKFLQALKQIRQEVA
jgi:hypothetical protein